jgi:hypothetical protein
LHLQSSRLRRPNFVAQSQPTVLVATELLFKKRREIAMIILLIILLLLTVGGLPAWPYSRGWGYYPSGGLGLILVVLLVLMLLGRL